MHTTITNKSRAYSTLENIGQELANLKRPYKVSALEQLKVLATRKTYATDHVVLSLKRTLKVVLIIYMQTNKKS